MKIAVMADIHGNIDALNAVLNAADSMGAERIFVCGDLTGYYYDTDAVVDTLSSRTVDMCRGNHEDLLSAWINEDSAARRALDTKYGSAFRNAAETLNTAKIDMLRNLPHPLEVITKDGMRFLLSHGTPWNIDAYVYPDAAPDVLNRFDVYAQKYDVIFTGHTHYPAAWAERTPAIYNPGSVGQPRSGTPDPGAKNARAEWGIFDTKDRRFTHHTTLYDAAPLFAKIAQFDASHPYLQSVLTRRGKAA